MLHPAGALTTPIWPVCVADSPSYKVILMLVNQQLGSIERWKSQTPFQKKKGALETSSIASRMLCWQKQQEMIWNNNVIASAQKSQVQ